MAFMAASGGGGDFTVYVKYNAKAGRWYTKDDEPNASEYEVTTMTAVFDMVNIKTGWFMFTPGQAPQKVMDPKLGDVGVKPDGDFKRGFELLVYSEKNLGGLREFSSTAGVVIDAMNALHDDWSAAAADHPGKCPLVKCSGVKPVNSQHGTNYAPKLEIIKWVDRPSQFGSELKGPEPAPKQAAKHAPPPVAVGGDDDDTEF